MKRHLYSQAILVMAAVLVAWTATASAQELILYTMPPPGSLDWSSPRSLLFGAAIANRLTFTHVKHKHTFGHVFIELRGPDGQSEFAGSTTAPDAPSDADFITKHGYGLGVFYANFRGALDTRESLEPQIADREKSGRLGFITFKLNRAQYNRLATYLREYKERGYDKIYNGLNRPREGLGAGCSAFGISFLEVGGFHRPMFAQQWMVHVRLPEQLIGGPTTGRRVSLMAAALGRWAREDEPHRVLSLYDPDLIFKWIVRMHQAARFQQVHASDSSEKGDYTDRPKLVKRRNALGIEYDVSREPLPREPIFLVPPPAR